MTKLKIPEMKPEFERRMKLLLSDEKDFEEYKKILRVFPVNSIRCNTLKISPEKLKNRLEKKGWKISQLWKNYPEVMIIENSLEPGELGRSLEHLLGYYYIQELASMLPPIALNPQENEIVVDLCSAPGSKTTQMSAKMKNTGTIIANEVSMGRLKILAANTERCLAANTIITRKDGVDFCKQLSKTSIKIDKILVDAPCSGEGTLRSAYKTYNMWSTKLIFSLSRLQKKLIKAAFELLQVGGEIIYSTCTHAPEENEEVIDFLIKEFPEKVEIQKINLPIKTRPGIIFWEDKKFDEKVKLCCRVYPQDNNTEGFFIAKLKKIK